MNPVYIVQLSVFTELIWFGISGRKFLLSSVKADGCISTESCSNVKRTRSTDKPASTLAAHTFQNTTFLLPCASNTLSPTLGANIMNIWAVTTAVLDLAILVHNNSTT